MDIQETQTPATGLSRFFNVPPALRYPKYRAYWLGMLASVGGFQVLMFAQGWLTYELTGSPLYLGYVSLASASSSIALNLFGGVFADKLDKRRLIFVTQLITASLIFLLAFLTLFKVVQVWHIIVIAFLSGAVNAFNQPAQQALYPHLIDRKVMMSAVALNSMLWQGSRIVLPGLGGVVIAFADTWAVFAAGAAGFMVMARVMASFAPTRAADVPLATGHSGRQFVDGFRFIFSHRMFWVLILLTYATTFFGISYIQLMPAFARLLGAGETGYGLLLSATGVGAIAGNLIVVPLQRSPRLGRVLLAAPMGGAAAIVAFTLCVALLPGATIGYVLALGCGMLTAVCMSMYFVASMTQLQLAVPDALRGRVMGIYTICFSLVPLGGLLGGVVAAVTSPPFAAALNAGVLAVVVAVMAVTQPSLRRLDGGATVSAEPDEREAARAP